MALKILVVTNMYPTEEKVNWGTFVQHQVNALERMGNKVDVYFIQGTRSKWNYIKAFLGVFFATFSSRYDIVHAHHGLAGVSSLLRFRTPLIITFHGTDVQLGRIQPFLSRLAARFSDATIVVSEKIASIIPGTIIPCGVDTSVFTPMDIKEARIRVGFPLDKNIVLFPFDPARKIKRYDLAQSAINELNEKGISVTLLPIWNIPNEKMPLFYAAADVMILCSDTEGSPTSVKEALSCNTPVVSTNVGDVSQIMKGIDNVAICEHTSTDLARGIELVLNNRKLRSFDGRTAMINRYDQQMIANSIMKVYDSVNLHRSKKQHKIFRKQ
jgi:glycosyltransferase involved in cell wall biosynthesis